MVDLISRKAAIEALGECPEAEYDEAWVSNPIGEYKGWLNAYHSILSTPSVPAVPLDKLCEWLARNAFAFECEDCNEYCRALLDCENEVGSDPKYWKNKLTKWIEEQDATDKC